MSIGTFCLVRNEAAWIAAHILRILPWIDEVVLFDGNSTDGTLEIIESIRKEDQHGHKIKLFTGKDPANLEGDYTRLFNECMWSLSTDLAFFLHPDMFVLAPQDIMRIKDSDAIALTTNVRSYAGEPGGSLYQIKGRASAWKNIYRLRNPDLGAHYFGSYGAANEDVYFSDITGTEHLHFGHRMDRYAYEVAHSGLDVMHFSDVRHYDRRLGRMKTCLLNQGYTESESDQFAKTHPRVTLKDGAEGTHGVEFAFTPAEYPAEFLALRAKYRHLEKETELVKT